MHAAQQMRPPYYQQIQGPGAGPGARPRWPSNANMPRMPGGQAGGPYGAPRIGGRPSMTNAGPRPGLAGQPGAGGPGGPRPLTGQQAALAAQQQQVNRGPAGQGQTGGPTGGRPGAGGPAAGQRQAQQFVSKQPNRPVSYIVTVTLLCLLLFWSRHTLRPDCGTSCVPTSMSVADPLTHGTEQITPIQCLPL
jgi:hypothetical protein